MAGSDSVGPLASSQSSVSRNSDDEAKHLVKKKSGCLFCRKEPPFMQTLVLLRHSEREDRVNVNYKQTEEGKVWPHDCPITANGVQLARDVAKEMLDLHKEVRFTVVVSSPYRRCLETAAEVAKKLKLPVMIDQEMGEVWDHEMSQDPPPWRTANQLKTLVKPLKMNVINPALETEDPVTNGGIKCFGKPPNWPESLDDAKARYAVRIETYIERSADTEQNFLIVTHADAVAAALALFERGGADIKDMDFCARVIARRVLSKKRASQSEASSSAYAANWDITTHALKLEKMDAQGLEKMYEKMHLDTCKEQGKASVKRREKRTKTDNMFDAQLGALRKQMDGDDDEDAGVKKKASKDIRASWEVEAQDKDAAEEAKADGKASS